MDGALATQIDYTTHQMFSSRLHVPFEYPRSPRACISCLKEETRKFSRLPRLPVNLAKFQVNLLQKGHRVTHATMPINQVGPSKSTHTLI